MFHNDIYKNYLIKRGDHTNINSQWNTLKRLLTFPTTEPLIEFLPLDEKGNPSYSKCLIWLYDGDQIEMFIDHLLEHNNFTPKNFKIIFY